MQPKPIAETSSPLVPRMRMIMCCSWVGVFEAVVWSER